LTYADEAYYDANSNDLNRLPSDIEHLSEEIEETRSRFPAGAISPDGRFVNSDYMRALQYRLFLERNMEINGWHERTSDLYGEQRKEDESALYFPWTYADEFWSRYRRFEDGALRDIPEHKSLMDLESELTRLFNRQRALTLKMAKLDKLNELVQRPASLVDRGARDQFQMLLSEIKGDGKIKGITVPIPDGERWKEFVFQMCDPDKYSCDVYCGKNGLSAASHVIATLDGENMLKTESPDDQEPLAAALNEFARDPLEFLSSTGKKLGKCLVCGLRLSDEKSIESGIGPKCAKYFQKKQRLV
jgi:hypothetical protein